MGILRWCIEHPVSVTVGVILLVFAGVIGLREIPIQLTPTVSKPQITVTTLWPGRSPEEVIDEITKEQEEFLKNVTNLETMASSTEEGQTAITLDFVVGADITRALQEVSDALRQVPSYPDEVDEPTIVAADGANTPSGAIAWIIIDFNDENLAKHQGYDLTTLFDALDKEVKPYLERIEGVAQVNVFGGREREARVFADPVALAQRGLNHIDVVNALRSENQNVSAGSISEGKREYRVRLVGRFTDPEQVLDTIVAYRDGRPVYVRDVATIELGHTKQRGFVRSLARPAIAINVIRQNDSNVMDIMEELKLRLSEVESDILPNLGGNSAAGPVGPDLRVRQVYDETTYIDSAISLVTQNLWVGGAIAAGVLLLFLRSWRATGIIAIAIPISVVGTFLVLLAMGRSLNVVSLAGLAFAVGMVVDNSIVVLENIDRRLSQGESAPRAALLGGAEVWGAIVASTLTTVAVFIPVLTIQEEAGQLFRDIAIAIVASVTLSLIVSIFVIPTACSRWLKAPKERGRLARAFKSFFGLTVVCQKGVDFLGWVIRTSITGVKGWTLRPALIVGLAAASVWGSLALMPPMDYLPAGNRNLVFGGLLIPPGLSLEQRVTIAERIEDQIYPYATAAIDEPSTVEALPDIQMFPGMPVFDPVPIDNFFIGAFGTGMFVGATSQDEEVVIPVGHLLTNAMSGIPDAFGGAGQSSLFGGLGSEGAIRVEVLGPNLDKVNAAVGFMHGIAMGRYGPQKATPAPANYSLEQQEMRIVLNDLGRELGLTNQGLGVAVRGLFDGAYVGDYTLGSEAIDLVVVPVGGELDYLEQLADIPIATPAGPVVPVSSVVDFVPTTSAQVINRIEELPSVSIGISPPEGVAIGEAMAWIQENMIDAARDAGLIDRSMRVRLEGSAADLQKIQTSMFGAAHEDSSGGRGLAVGLSLLVAGVTLAVCVGPIVRSVRSRNSRAFYGVAGAVVMALVLGVLSYTLLAQPQLMTARMVWALLVTYLLMCALFESFLYPFVILFSVPLAVVGGFGGLALVHWWTLQDPTKAPQQLDVLTMLGFIILIGVVVNNAILLVHQALNFMRGEAAQEPMNATDAIVESVKTRTRPIFMSVMTSVGGMLPLVLVPGSGSEMYRGLGSVVVGGLLVSTVFTLLLVPLVFSLVMDMRAGLRPVDAPELETVDLGLERVTA